MRKNSAARMAALNIIPYGKVEAALSQTRETFREQREYNTNFHTREEITEALPQLQHFAPDEQPWILLGPWLDLIMFSRGLRDEDVHRIQLPGTFLVQLVYASKVALQMCHLAKDDAEDLADAFPRTTIRGDDLDELLRGSENFFVRLDTCSLKDALVGNGYIKDVQDLWTRLATSARGMSGIRSLRDSDMSMPVYVYLFPWREGMRTELEYRVYCPPLLAGGIGPRKSAEAKISAISQYNWHTPWYHSSANNEHQNIAQRLLKSCQVLHKEIMAHPAMTEQVKSRGFVFDVIEDPRTQDVQLIELNAFGAMTGCGACLFHWVRDAKLLYGLEEKVEVRVTI